MENDYNINIQNILKKENESLKNELVTYKNDNNELHNKINKLKVENDNLKNELNKAYKIISNLNNDQNNKHGLNNLINNFNEMIKMKDKEINDLKNKLKNNDDNQKYVNYNDIMVVNFISLDQNINCGIKCLKTDTFAEVEEKLYQKYDKYRDTNNNFVAKGKLILRFKKIYENDIKDGDKIQLLNIENGE